MDSLIILTLILEYIFIHFIIFIILIIFIMSSYSSCSPSRYEEVLVDCHPSSLFKQICTSFWNSSRAIRKSEYQTLREVLQDDNHELLVTTLYRQCVMWFRPDLQFNLPESSVWRMERMERILDYSFDNNDNEYYFLSLVMATAICNLLWE